MTGPPAPAVTPREALGVWTRVAVQSFGGPAGQIAVIHRIVVDEKKWLSEARFLHALSYCMLLPGPEAQQLATYVGWLLHGTRGGLAAGMLFILPGFLSILALSVLYAGYRDVGVVAGLFFGLKPAVIAIVAHAVIRLRRRALTSRLGIAIAAAAFIALFVFGVAFPIVVVGAGAVGYVAYRTGRLPGLTLAGDATTHAESPVQPPSLAAAARTATLWLTIWLVPLILLLAALGPDHVFVREGIFFSKAAIVTFGGAYSVLSYVAQMAVETYGWLEPAEMLDGLGMAETTPGPLIQVVQFFGFMGAYQQPGALDPMVSGIIGSVVATWMTFAPCFLFVFVGAPFVEYLRGNRSLNAALQAIMAAVVGVVLNLAVWFALHTLFAELQVVEFGGASLLLPIVGSLDPFAALIAVAAATAMFRFSVPMLPILAGAALVGAIVQIFR